MSWLWVSEMDMKALPLLVDQRDSVSGPPGSNYTPYWLSPRDVRRGDVRDTTEQIGLHPRDRILYDCSQNSCLKDPGHCPPFTGCSGQIRRGHHGDIH